MNDRLPDWTALREEFPTLARWTYLDVARKTIPPRCQERALQDYVRDVYDNAGAEAWAATLVPETRAALAQLLGAKPPLLCTVGEIINVRQHHESSNAAV